MSKKGSGGQTSLLPAVIISLVSPDKADEEGDDPLAISLRPLGWPPGAGSHLLMHCPLSLIPAGRKEFRTQVSVHRRCS